MTLAGADTGRPHVHLPARLWLASRAYLFGLAGIVVIAYITAWAEIVAESMQISIHQFPPSVIAVFFLLIMGGKLARRVTGRLGLNGFELLTIYTMMLLGAMLSSRGLMERLLPLMVGVNYYADATNNWARIYFGHIPQWLVPWNTAGPEKQWVTRAFFEGLQKGERIPWGLWIGPLAVWFSLMACIFTAFICLSTILHRQWADNEKLTYPLAQIPVEMIRDQTLAGSPPLFRSPLLWMGFAIPFAVHSLNGLSRIYPVVPSFRTAIYLNSYFISKPWSDISFWRANISFAAIGFFYLLPVDITFSFWFFYLFGKLQDVVGSMFGMTPAAAPHATAYLYLAYETVGGFIVLAIYFIYLAWPHIRRILDRRQRIDDSRELLPYRVAFVGLFVGLAGACLWCYLTGMSLWVAAFELGIYVFVQAIIMARSTTEGGLLETEGSFTPLDVIGAVTNKGVLGPRNLTALAWTQGILTRDLRGITLTGYLDTQKIADGVGVARRRMLATYILAIIATFVIAAYIQLRLPYERGALSLYPYQYQFASIQFFREDQPLIQRQPSFTWQAPTFLIAGALFTAFLGFMRLRFYWWPFHPLGYAMSASWALVVFWFPMMVAWALKGLTLRYGGMRGFVRARPFFLGLVFGELIAAVVWAILAGIWHFPAPYIAVD